MAIKISQHRMDMGGVPIRSAGTIEITAAPGADTTASGLIIELTAAADMVFGDVCYLDSSGQAVLADATAIATGSAIAMALGTINGEPTPTAGNFLLHGIARNDAWNWTIGGLLYLSHAAGSITQTIPPGADAVVQILGVATHADRIYFNPSLVQVERVS